MTEWERMQKGLVYNDFDQDLFNKRVEAKKLFKAYNKTDDEEIDLRNKIMQQLFKKIGKNVQIEPDFRCEFGKNITIGDDVYINFGCIILDCSEVTIGNNVVIGGGSVVVKDIPSDSVAVGNPCKVIRKITEEDKKKCWDKL